MSEISNSPPLRVLFEGPIWPGSDSAPCFGALVRLGHRALDIDHNEYLSFSWSGFVLRSARRMLAPLMVKEYNQKIMRLAEGFKPDIFLAFKGELVLPQTLRRMREQGVRLYNFYPDTWVSSSFSPWLTESLGEYDCIFSTKRFTARDLAARGRPARNFVYLPHGYDPELHRPAALSPRDLEIYGCDVTFIGAFSPGKSSSPPSWTSCPAWT